MFVMLEELDLAEALLGLFERLIRTSQIPALARNYLVTILQLLDHVRPLSTKKFPRIRPAGCRAVYAFAQFMVSLIAF